MKRSVFGAMGAAVALGAAGGVATGAAAQAGPGAGPNGGLLPAVPTTHVLAIGHLTPKATLSAMRETLPGEVAATVRLYLAGKLDRWYSRQDRPGVVFVLNVKTASEAHELLEKLPLGVAGLMDFDLVPLGPLAPLGLLLEAGPGH